LALEASLAPRHGAGEGTLLVAEKLALEQRVGDRGAVDLDERLAGAQALPVDLAGDQLFSGAVLTQDHDSGVHRRALPDQLLHPTHGGTFADHRVLEEQVRLELAVFPLQLLDFQGVHGDRQRLVDRQRLLDEIPGAAFHGLHRHIDRGVARDHHHGNFGVVLADGPKDVQPAHARHPHVEEHEVDHLGLEQLQSRGSVGGSQDGEALVLEHVAQNVPNAVFVVDDQNGSLQAHGRSSVGRSRKNVVPNPGWDSNQTRP